MKGMFLAALIMLSFVVAGCGNKAADLYSTAEFEELQNNKEHAIKLYEEIERKYPASEQAKKAQARLAALKAEKK